MNRQIYDMNNEYYASNEYETLYLDNIKTLQGGCSQNVVIKAIKASISITGDAPTMTLEPNKALITLTMRWNVNDWGGKDSKTRGRIIINSAVATLLYLQGNETTNMTGNIFTVTLPLDIVKENTTVKVIYEVVAFDGTTWYINTSVNYVDRTLVAYKPAVVSGISTNVVAGMTIVNSCTALSLSYNITLNHDISAFSYFYYTSSGAFPTLVEKTQASAEGSNTQTISPTNVKTGASISPLGLGITVMGPSIKHEPYHINPTLTVEDKTDPVHKSCSALPTSIIIGDNIVTTVTVTGGNCDRNAKFEIYKNAALCATADPVTVIGNKSDQSWNITIPSAACLSPEGTYAIDVKMVLA